ncbi:DNA cytosine methyltransferase [Pedobacter sp. KR3-3]|uniref:DNA (cytosine-5-)-methyltransferase n=1 Tax=Pedobacter albus TaxID=3113905 RepID=A0ABU7ICF3_9SPHI|nr:DNA cytosine methyltransferase [Pedobacter sp. KR3-3]MEE1946961.1 DNA cytosine methyltransferase [Pedobacter sp. KR3-3]
MDKRKTENVIPIIDLFAGPGGLGEGFSSLIDENNERVFKIRLSIEKDEHAHQTLKLRSFFRQFKPGKVPEDYYTFVRGGMTIDELYKKYPKEATHSDEEAWCGTLGIPDKDDKNGVSNEDVDERIKVALAGNTKWLLIGGPPCQAYSLAGRSRRKETILDSTKDKRVDLYKEYLRIIAVHSPAIFVMENVKGLLSAKTEEENIFRRILNDLSDPVTACLSEGEKITKKNPATKYRIYSLTTETTEFDSDGNPIFNPKDFLIKAEDYGIPQKRHRIILLGVREDCPSPEGTLEKSDQVSLESVIGKLPPVRSGITRLFSHSTIEKDNEGNPKKKRHYIKVKDSYENWLSYVNDFDKELDGFIGSSEHHVNTDWPTTLGREFWPSQRPHIDASHQLESWYKDKKLAGILHHVSRKHLIDDLKRYLFASRYTSQKGTFPRLEDYKLAGNNLLPDHENAESGKFSDRFRVQLPDIPATTVTSHISKDGHYFIHYDSVQCRSFTVREAARVQTFPDNYFFCGERTQQFHQVGNAVPPFLAFQIANVVHKIFQRRETESVKKGTKNEILM